MSMRQYRNSRIRGWEGPFFPPLIARLPAALEATPANRNSLERAMAKAPGFAGISRPPVATDGYLWYWQLVFDVAGGFLVAIALPWMQDWSRADGTTMDRSPAVYANGDVRLATMDVIVARVIRALRPGPMFCDKVAK